MDISYLILETDRTIKKMTGSLNTGEAQAIVGGNFTALPTPRNFDVTMLRAEDGKQMALQPNWTATSIVKSRLRPDDYVVGRVIVAGPATEAGELTSIDPEVEDALRRMLEA